MGSPTENTQSVVRSQARGRWRWVLGIGLLVILVFVSGPRELGAVLWRSSPGWVAVLIGGTLVWLLLGALNVWLLLRRLTSIELHVFVRAYLRSWVLSLLVPGQLGDSTQVLLLRRAGVPIAASGAAYILDKAISLAWLGSVATCGIAFYTRLDILTWLLSVAGMALAVVVGIGLLRQVPPQRKSWLRRAEAAVDSMVRQLFLFRSHPWDLAQNFGVTVAKWALATGLYLAAFRAVDTSIGIKAAATIPFMVSLVAYVPVTVAGAGTMELTAVVLFTQLGIESTRVLSAYLLVRGAILLALALLLACESQVSRRSRL